MAQLGILLNAATYPRIIQSHATLEQLVELKAIGWITPRQFEELNETIHALRGQKMVTSLTGKPVEVEVNTDTARDIFFEKLPKG